MHRIDTAGHDEGLFQDGDPQVGQQGTVLDAAWANAVQEEIVAVVEAAGIDLEKGQNDQLLAAIQALITGAAVDWTGDIEAVRTRPGIMAMFGGGAAPVGWLECDGSAVSRTTYDALYAAIGNIWGSGDGATTFNLPDMRGMFARGWDHGAGVDAGRELGTYQADELKAHTHTVAPAASTDDTASGATTTGSGGVETITPYATGSTGGAETRPKNKAMMFIIKT